MRTGRRRLLAVLAGGIVLAGGGVTTLASWHDQVLVKAPVSLSALSVLASVDDTTWVRADDAANPGAMRLAVSGAVGALLAPGGATTAWVGLRADKGSSGAHIDMALPTVGSDASGLAPHLKYQVTTFVSRTACQAGSATFAGVAIPLVGTGSGATALPSFDLPAGTATAMGDPVGVCFKLALDDGLDRSLGGTTVNPVWRFDATSTDS